MNDVYKKKKNIYICDYRPSPVDSTKINTSALRANRLIDFGVWFSSTAHSLIKATYTYFQMNSYLC